ncbi:adhesion G protein-coupled receptor L4 [Nasonia vitripennis]|uniref:G-protein coupled receptors family 2 profile 2 domain-containing protein n=1 Tax=Nasonia vitripennis TaxID=7425 RepID=A0A7M7PYL9_NASVI|nr:adhesion G protein-coupled receptor L4 [Nasonia vitripennis]
METLYTGAIHGFPQASNGLANGISSGLAASFDQDGVLSLVVVLGGSLSLVALVFAFITYSLFSDLRSLAGTTLMNLLAALFMVQLLFIVGVGGVQDSQLCISLGMSLQYLRVSVVCWLAAMCHHLYATVASIPNRDDPPTYLKYSVFAWGAPLVSLGGATLLQMHETNDIWKVDDLMPFNCWFLGAKATVYAFGIPVILLLLSAGYYLLKAAIVARYTCSMQLEIKQREKMKRRRALQLMLFLKVSLIIGLVVGCGVASRVWKVPFLWAVFCTGHSLQGLAVALSVACNCRVLKIYSRKSYKQPKHQIAKSSSMQLLAPAPDPV